MPVLFNIFSHITGLVPLGVLGSACRMCWVSHRKCESMWVCKYMHHEHSIHWGAKIWWCSLWITISVANLNLLAVSHVLLFIYLNMPLQHISVLWIWSVGFTSPYDLTIFCFPSGLYVKRSTMGMWTWSPMVAGMAMFCMCHFVSFHVPLVVWLLQVGHPSVMW